MYSMYYATCILVFSVISRAGGKLSVPASASGHYGAIFLNTEVKVHFVPRCIARGKLNNSMLICNVGIIFHLILEGAECSTSLLLNSVLGPLLFYS